MDKKEILIAMDENKVRYYLDKILSYLKGEKQVEIDLGLTASETYIEMDNHIKILDRKYITALKEITDTQFTVLLNKLEKDKFIKKISLKTSPFDDNQRGDKYVLTIDGLLFEGYSQQKIKTETRLASIRLRKERTENNNERLVLWTKILAIGSIALLFWEMRHFLLRLVFCH